MTSLLRLLSVSLLRKNYSVISLRIVKPSTERMASIALLKFRSPTTGTFDLIIAFFRRTTCASYRLCEKEPSWLVYQC